ncbi:NAD(P)-dependent dehydrogenase, short-chain alcohol dehydrogenase family [Streptosporangium subroseum]|uniref:NAD(P)-dependent dehydrogenase, short-chain alcohol dehydrogenase family n=1 Tax=Streptosporangium subroseum TaxID=106412 RepID=A0A239LJR0_9ACTN|nr:SDR family NAD(P)-dependent oxidoreductase [Streptosporangium subroseum]SNT30826.1 NAD(P)-dependent dehydrogenase, short-chain alcohol dehydrogenase family [Streptosporangium subroseum]
MPRQRWTAADVPGQHGRVAVITGANTGVGFETAKVLAARGASVVLAVRDVDKGKRAAAQITASVADADIRVQRLDLASLASVRAAADELRDTHARIDLLINNAGVMYTPRSVTEDGFELQLGTNHLGHFALTGLLLDKMLRVPRSRVVTVSSAGHRQGGPIDFDDLDWNTNEYSRVAAYGHSKLANLMFTYELQRRLSGKGEPIATAAHPGGSDTGGSRASVSRQSALFRAAFALVRPLLIQSSEMGALPTLRAATDPAVQGGQYYGPDGFSESKGHPKVVKSSARSYDTAAQRRLWTISEELTGVSFPV